MTAAAITSILYTSMASFYPIYMATNFPQLSLTHFGFILAIYEIANLIASIFLGIYIGRVKRKNLIIYSNIYLFIATLAFTTLDFLGPTQDMTFFILSLIFRVIQGIASAAIQICAYSFATFEMNHDKDTYIGYVEMALGVGGILGPAIASFIFDFVGYVGTFVFFSGIVFVGIIQSKIRIPNTLNERTAKNQSMQLDNDQTTEIEKQNLKQLEYQVKIYSELKYIDFIQNSECFIILLTACLSVVFTVYIEAILAIQLYKYYGVQQNLIGLFFLSASILYVIGAPLASWLAKYIHKRIRTFLSFGPSIVRIN
ncbi:permeases of the major facilitator superfamily [Stylonychia lemnae]|uniref:Permeases of the major facilitator superfamily n=1 Tax=Stylonychia lemnae TaxID=5949 RepID=A0A077ZS52_STYLE|nr:permeases of the major facilitator superfamily [Stylonychia lemnae]|eukprot:CDW72728.1 permeases of the major facilitator superfamily [Stylonychia lemnae]